MVVRQIDNQQAFVTKDGSSIREIINHGNAPMGEQSLAEARLPAGLGTARHYHKASEEIYYILSGTGVLEVGDESREVGAGDGILIPAGSWHRITAKDDMVFLCCCAPRYTHEDTYFE